MIKEFIGTGKTVEEATQNAKLQLNAPEMATFTLKLSSIRRRRSFLV